MRVNFVHHSSSPTRPESCSSYARPLCLRGGPQRRRSWSVRGLTDPHSGPELQPGPNYFCEREPVVSRLDLIEYLVHWIKEVVYLTTPFTHFISPLDYNFLGILYTVGCRYVPRKDLEWSLFDFSFVNTLFTPLNLGSMNYYNYLITIITRHKILRNRKVLYMTLWIFTTNFKNILKNWT